MPAEFRFAHLPITDHKDTTAVLEQLHPIIRGLQNQGQTLESRLSRATTGLPGAWAETTLSAKIEALAEYQTIRVRTEQAGTVARLRGGGKIKAAEEIAAGATILTVPVGYRPLAKVQGLLTGASGSAPVTVTTAGVLSCSAALKAAEIFVLDGITWNVT